MITKHITTETSNLLNLVYYYFNLLCIYCQLNKIFHSFEEVIALKLLKRQLLFSIYLNCHGIIFIIIVECC